MTKQEVMRIARVLVDVADDLMWEDITPQGCEEQWEIECFGALVKAHNTFNVIYLHDTAFMSGETENNMRKHFKAAVKELVEKGGAK